MQRCLLILCFMLFVSAGVFAQNAKTITGVVKDASTGETLIGVSVSEPGTSNGIMTDFDGNFSIDVNGNKIRISYVGYKAQELEVTQSKEVTVLLSTDTELDEVIVVGYTAMKKREVLGAISKVKSEELVAVPNPGVAEALQGRISGVQVSSASGAPGAGVTVRIRGTGSINSSNDPLYIVDGIPMEGGINSIAPSDIEDVSVLKDASSAAIYGSRANNGVVLITTKRGKSGKVKISYNGQFGVQTRGELTDMVNTNEYINIYNEAARADGRILLEGAYLKDFADVNHMKEIFRTAMLNVHELSVSGGTKKLDYMVSTSYYDQEGIIKNSDYNKLAGRGNINYKATDWLKIGLNAGGGKSKKNEVPSSGDGYGSNEGGSVVRYAYMRNPAIPVYDAAGKFVDRPSEYFGEAEYNSFFGDGYNPLGVAKMASRVRDEDTFYGKVNAEVKLPYKTMWNTNFGVDYYKSKFNIHNKTWGTLDRINNPSSKSLENKRKFGWTFNSVLNSIHTFNEVHTLNAMLGTEVIHYSGKDKNSSSSINGNTEYGSKWAYSLISFFGKVDYNYNYKYYLSALAREDGSSRFTKGNRWGTFYSVSAGWDIHQEDFLKEVKILNLLKLRAGWGVVGNQDVALYAYTDKYTPYYNYPFGGSPSVGYIQSSLGNKDLKWETSSQLNIGIDVAFSNGEYGFSVDYFDKKSKDMLVRASLPPSIGNASPYWINAGKVMNRGVDVELFYRKQFGDFGFATTVNWGFLKNKVLSLDAPIQAGRIDNGVYAKYLEEGYSIGSFYLYEMAGVFQNQEEIVKSAYQGSSVQPGDVKYKDLNKDGVIDEKDRKHIGSSIPKHTLGINLQGNYKNWDMSVFFQGAFGHKIFNQMAQETEGFHRGFAVTKDYYDGYWRGEGTTNTHPRPSWYAKSNNVRNSTRFLESASYMRLKNVQIGYTIPLKTKYISRLRVYGSATNLLTFTGYSGLDPEMTVSANSRGEGDVSNGIDWGTYPVSKSYTVGVNITF